MISQPVVGAELGVEREPAQVLVVLQDVLEHAVVDAQHHVGIHLDEAAVAVVGEPLVARLGGQAFDGLVVEAEVEDGVHHAGHGRARARAHRDQQRRGRVAERGADGLADVRQRGLDLLLETVGQLAAVGIVGRAHLGGDGEARRHRQAQARHLGQIGALAAQQLLHLRPCRRPCRRRTGRRACSWCSRRLPRSAHAVRSSRRASVNSTACPIMCPYQHGRG